MKISFCLLSSSLMLAITVGDILKGKCLGQDETNALVQLHTCGGKKANE